MAAIYIRNLPEVTQKALKRRARHFGRSLETEVCSILIQAVHKESPIRLGSALKALAHPGGGFDLKIIRDSGPAQGADVS